MMLFTLYITYDGMILFLWKILKLKIECWDKIPLLARGPSPALEKIILIMELRKKKTQTNMFKSKITF